MDNQGALENLVSNSNNMNRKMGELIQRVEVILPQAGTVSPTAAAGQATLPSNPVGFVIVDLPGVGNVKFPYYGE